MSELIATVDVGTNTAHLLLARITDDGEAVPVHSETRFVRLGQGIDATGEVHPAALARLREALLAFSGTARGAGVTRTIAVGTSASRDARNRSELVRYVKRETGLDYRILSGEEEALLTSIGALSGLAWTPDKAVIVDIGGGSTELTRAARLEGRYSIDGSVSIDLGSVRITERCFSSLPPPEPEIRAARQMASAAFAGMEAFAAVGPRFVGAAGTIRALALVDAGVTSCDNFPPDDLIISRSTCRSWCDRLLKLDYDRTLALNPAVMQGRADVFAAGVLLLDHLFSVLDAVECAVSPWGLRHGLAVQYASLKKQRHG